MTTYYIAPETGDNGNDGLSEAAPKLTAASITEALGDTLLWKRGETDTASINWSWTGNGASEAQRITFGAYGTGANPIIDINNGANFCWQFTNKDYITVQDINFTDSTQDGLRFTGNSTRAPSNIVVQRVNAYLNRRDGILFQDGTTEPPSAGTNNIVRDVIATNNGRHGVSMQGKLTGGVISWCYGSGNSTTESGWNLYIAGVVTTINDGTSWTLASGAMYETTNGKVPTWEPVAVLSNVGTTHLTSGTFDALAAGEFAYSAGVLQVRLSDDSDPDLARIDVIFGYGTNHEIVDCIVHDPDAAFDDIGMGIDRGASGGTLRRCLSYNAGNDAFNVARVDGGATSLSCVSHTNGRSGFRLGNNSGANGGTLITRQCSTNNDTTSGHNTNGLPSGHNVTVQNFISATVATSISDEGTITGTITEDYNCLAGTAARDATISAGSNSITTAPAYRSATDLRLDGGSPCIATGSKWWTGNPPQGEDGLRHFNSPEMGAYAFTPRGGGAYKAGVVPARTLGAGVDIAKARAA